MDDETLIAKIMDGDKDSFAELVNRYKEMAYYLARDLLNSHEDAEDISQEAFIRVFKKIKGFRHDASFKTWFTKILVNLSRNHLRHRYSTSRIIQPPDEVEDRPDRQFAEIDRKWTANPEGVAINSELNKAIERAINSLPARQREIFILKHLNSYKIKEIAEILGCAEGTVKAQLFRAIGNLRSHLKEWS